tara:strand:- start:193 stop:663 length:471 start_codon:yes stop_codon:yes gene_type:complete
MATTRIKAANSTQVYHRHAAANDAPSADVSTNEALASGLGSSADFQLDSDDNQTWTDESSVAAATGETAMESLSNPILVWIKHSGFQDANKTTASTATTTVKIGIGGAATNGFISLFPGESIMIHGFGTNVDNLNDFDMITSASEAVYVEVKAMVD